MKKILAALLSLIIVFNCFAVTCFAANSVSGDEEVISDLKADEESIIETADDTLSDYFGEEPYNIDELFDYGKFIRLYSRGLGLFSFETLDADDITEYIENYNYDYYYYLPVTDRGTTIYLDIQGTAKFTDEEIENYRNNYSEEEVEEIIKEKPWRIVGENVYPFVLDFKQELNDILDYNKIDNSVSYVFPLSASDIFMFAAICLDDGEVKFAILNKKIDGLQELVNENETDSDRIVSPLEGYEYPVDYKLYTYEEMKEMLSDTLKSLEQSSDGTGISAAVSENKTNTSSKTTAVFIIVVICILTAFIILRIIIKSKKKKEETV